jgi:NADH-quinone oxidoreductase subunit M
MNAALIILLIFQLLSAGAVKLSGNGKAWTVAFLSSVLSLVLTVMMLMRLPLDNAFHYTTSFAWIKSLGISFSTGIDGLGGLMLLLTNGLVPLILLSACNRETEKASSYFSLIIFMQFALNGVFTARDGFLFYVFWELALIPIWLICWLWGGKNSMRITLRFFIYTLTGSLFMLAAIIYLGIQSDEYQFGIETFYNLKLSSSQQAFVFFCMMAAFAIKIPVFPFHSWQPDTYTDSPTQGTMLLSGIMLKMGLYGIIRWLIPVVPEAVQQYGHYIITLAVIGIVYGSLMALAQTDFKRMIAYSSIAHVGLITAGLFTLKAESLHGGIVQMMAHGINVVGLFFIADILIHRMKTRQMKELGGLAHTQRWFSVFFLIILLGSVGLPLTNGFAGEFMLLTGIYQYGALTALFAGLTVILGAVYMLRAYKAIMLGEKHGRNEQFHPLKKNEMILLGIICMLIFITGIFPSPILKLAGSLAGNISQLIL